MSSCSISGIRSCSSIARKIPTAVALLDESPVTAIPSSADPAFYVDQKRVLRQFSCPGCHVQVCAAVAKADL
jgi:hypothetical protein